MTGAPEAVSIEKAYLMVTTECNDACRFCIVRKGSEEMDAATIEASLALVLGSPGTGKKVAVYGGEPLVRLDLVEETVRALARLVAAGAPPAKLFVYTNGMGLDEEVLGRIDRWGIDLVVSLDVCQELSPSGSRSPRHEATFPVKLAHARRAVERLGTDRVCVASVLLPGEVDRLVPAATWLWDEVGVDVIKVLPALGGYHWTPEGIGRLGERLGDLAKVLSARIAGPRPVFFDMVNESLLRAATPRPAGAVPLSVVEFYPGRTFGLSPCEFELPAGIHNVNDTDRYRIGSLDAPAGDLVARARALDGEPRHSALLRMSLWSEALAVRVDEKARTDPRVARWAERARRLSFA